MKFEQIIKIRQELFGLKKEGFPIPSPETDEDEKDFMSRCISDISSEYDHDQAVAICIKKWDES